jgi:hypothetical protein
MLVEFHRRSHGRVLTGKLKKRGLYLAAAFLGRFYDGFGIYALMDVKGDCGDLKRGVLGFPGPDEMRIEMRIEIRSILIGLEFTVHISGGCDQPDWWII